MAVKYVDVFYGNGETDRFIKEGIASKWFYIKALCGNTIPHATLPFGKMSVGAYSGGYPSGYGTHFPNSCGGIQKMSDELLIRGFSHLHQSGTGGIRYYYNYAIATPFYGDSERIYEYSTPKNETAHPGYYSVELNGILCELTTNFNTAFHRYTFPKDCGRIAVDFSNDGLSKQFQDIYYGTVEKDIFEVVESGTVYFSGIFSGIKLYFAAEIKNATVSLLQDKMCAVFDCPERVAELRLSYSTIDFAAASANLENEKRSFDEIKEDAYNIWENHLSVIEIETSDEALKEKFYSNFYHSIVKPMDATGESILGISGDVVTDIATFWDQYKTVFPLIMLLYPEMGRKIAKGIVNMSEALKRIPCSLGITDIFPCEEQAKMLGIYVLLDAYYAGLCEKKDIEACIKRELEREDYKLFLEKGIFDRYTHIIDVTDALIYASVIVEDTELKQTMIELAENWVNAYDTDGLMSENSPYYEGDRYTYSFRPQANMDSRIEIAGGKECFSKMLDDFFGFNGESVEQITCMDAFFKLEAAQHHRFEGFNNECDMETPYSYIFTGRHDRLCEIVRACVKDSFGTGIHGLPGNNDSGGLSSCFMWNVLGIFPLSGSGKFMLGAPQTDGAKIKLGNGKVLQIRAHRESSDAIYVKKILFNGVEITDYTISADDIFTGGILEFFME